MEVILSLGLQAKLARIAEERGTNPQDLAREAIERLVDYDDWFVCEVDKGLAQVRGGRHAHPRGSRRPSQQAPGR
jgi:predicted transcriptional regulator